MPRAPRINLADSFYHVTARGNNRSRIFHSPGDYRLYLGLLRNYKDQYGFSIHSYALMPNHIHLLLESHDPNLSTFMHRLQTTYAIYLNETYDRVGHVFQGRYSAFLIEKETYLLEATRYIHMNPVNADLALTPEQYPWSSMRAYMGNPDAITTTRAILEFYRSTNPIKSFHEFTVARLPQSQEDILSSVADRIQPGNPKFVERTKTSFAIHTQDSKTTIPSPRRIASLVAARFKITKNKLLRGTRNPHIANARACLMLLLRKKTLLSLQEVASLLSLRYASSVSLAVSRLRKRIDGDPVLSKNIRCIETQLSL